MSIKNKNKVIRTICLFSKKINQETISRINKLADKVQQANYQLQTKRICCNNESINDLDKYESEELLLSPGTLNREAAQNQIQDFLKTGNVLFNLNVGSEVKMSDVDLLFQFINEAPHKTFHFAYTFQNQHSSPFFPSADYNQPGFSIGFQLTNLSENCDELSEWFDKIQQVWKEIDRMFSSYPDFLGIDSSIAPMFTDEGSLANLVNRLKGNFSEATTTDLFVNISNFIKQNNPRPIGLQGLMFPCLEDFELAQEYEKGNFDIERNIFLSLHSGLGIDTYPIGVDEDKERVLDILRLMRKLSQKYNKPLSVRLVSDGQARIGEKTDFQNKYLKDVTVRPL